MRILHVIPFFAPQMGGSAQAAYGAARALATRGHDVTVVAGDYGSRNSRFEAAPFQLVMLPNVTAQSGFYVTPALWPWLREHIAGFDVIHMHTVRTFQNAVAQHFAARAGVPYVLSAHGTLPVIVQRQLFKRGYDLLFGRRLLAGASRLIAVSQVEADQYRRAGIRGDRVRVVYNGLDTTEFANLPPRNTFRRRHELAPATKVILFLGRLHPVKGINYLIEAFARLLPTTGDAVLLVVGPDAGALANLRLLAARLGIRERVRFLGPLYGSDRLSAMVDADVLASPGVYEIFGLAPFEALMCGTPVVVGDAGGTAQLFGDTGAGYMVSAGDVGGLAAALRRALTNRQEAMHKVRAGQSFVCERLDWRVVVRDLEQVYAEAVAKS